MIQGLLNISEPYREKLIDEFSEIQNGEHALCPNVTHFSVLGGLRSSTFLQLRITHTEASNLAQIVKDAFVVVYDISTVFEPEAYLENGF